MVFLKKLLWAVSLASSVALSSGCSSNVSSFFTDSRVNISPSNLSLTEHLSKSASDESPNNLPVQSHRKNFSYSTKSPDYFTQQLAYYFQNYIN